MAPQTSYPSGAFTPAKLAGLAVSIRAILGGVSAGAPVRGGCPCRRPDDQTSPGGFQRGKRRREGKPGNHSLSKEDQNSASTMRT